MGYTVYLTLGKASLLAQNFSPINVYFRGWKWGGKRRWWSVNDEVIRRLSHNFYQWHSHAYPIGMPSTRHMLFKLRLEIDRNWLLFPVAGCVLRVYPTFQSSTIPFS